MPSKVGSTLGWLILFGMVWSMSLLRSFPPAGKSDCNLEVTTKVAANTEDVFSNDKLDEIDRLVKQIRLEDPYLLNGKDSFSACLIWMDDNHRLPEWIAYHYFTLPLRNLVIAVDPHSNDQFPKIDKEWFELMNITVWHDHDYLNSDLDLRRSEEHSPQDLEHLHYLRQGIFFRECARHLKYGNQKFAMYLDMDEFITINDEYFAKHGDPHNFTSNNFKMVPGQVTKVIKTHRKETRNRANMTDYMKLKAACINLPRAQYGAGESSVAERKHMVPDWVDPLKFDTLRFRCRSTPIGERHHLGKVYIDVSQIDDEEFETRGDAHRPLRPACDLNNSRSVYGSIPVGIHHYMGSWESFTFRDDPRKAGGKKSKEKWLSDALDHQGGCGDEIRPWMEGFVNNMGVPLAMKLLQGAGLPGTEGVIVSGAELRPPPPSD